MRHRLRAVGRTVLTIMLAHWSLSASAAAPAEQPQFTGLLTLAERNARLGVCQTCEHFTELSACGCNPFCRHAGLRAMKASLRPNHWLRAAQCPAGKWPESPAAAGA